MDWLEIVGKVGFPVAVALYLLWQSREDKKELNDRFSGLETFCRTDLKKIAEDSTKVIEKNNEVVRDNTNQMADFKKALEKNTNVTIDNTKAVEEFKSFLSNRN